MVTTDSGKHNWYFTMPKNMLPMREYCLWVHSHFFQQRYTFLSLQTEKLLNLESEFIAYISGSKRQNFWLK